MDDIDLPPPVMITRSFTNDTDNESSLNSDDSESDWQHRHALGVADALVTGLIYLKSHVSLQMFCDFFHLLAHNTSEHNAIHADFMRMKCNTLEWLETLCNDDRRRFLQLALQQPNLPFTPCSS
jgi:hypothetical protein